MDTNAEEASEIILSAAWSSKPEYSGGIMFPTDATNCVNLAFSTVARMHGKMLSIQSNDPNDIFSNSSVLIAMNIADSTFMSSNCNEKVKFSNTVGSESEDWGLKSASKSRVTYNSSKLKPFCKVYLPIGSMKRKDLKVSSPPKVTELRDSFASVASLFISYTTFESMNVVAFSDKCPSSSNTNRLINLFRGDSSTCPKTDCIDNGISVWKL
mmetsp:Transcript_362/g.752  ORF Transcript_362/g.752 Transcript_362/m.752 type:complete len:212 (+) Transcript_362:400-1035(+)